MAGIKVRALGNPGVASAIRDALLSLPDNERKFVITDPSNGERRVYSIRRNAEGNIEYDYEKEEV